MSKIMRLSGLVFALSSLFLDYQLVRYKDVFLTFLNAFEYYHLKEIILLVFAVSSVLLLLNRFIAFAAAITLIKLFLISYDHFFFKEVYFDYLGLYLLILLITNIIKDFNFNQALYFRSSLAISYFVAGLSKLFFYVSYKDSSVPLLSSINDVLLFNINVSDNNIFLSICLAQLLLPIGFVFKKTLPWAWLLLTTFQLILLFTTNLTHITLVVLAFHMLAYDTTWFAPLNRKLRRETA